MAASHAADERGTRRPERELLAAARAEGGPRARPVGAHVRLLVGAGRLPTVGLQPVVGDDPRVHGVRQQRRAAWARAPIATASAASRRASRSGSRTRGAPPASERTVSPLIQPSGATLRGPSSRARRARSTAAARSSTSRNCAGGSSSATGSAVDRARARASQPLPSADDRDGGSEDRDGGGRVGVAPLGRRALELRLLRRRDHARVRSERRVLGERHRVVRPGAVDDGAREQHDVLGADGRRGVEDTAGQARRRPPRARPAPPGRWPAARWTTVVAPSNRGLRSAAARSTTWGSTPGIAGASIRRSRATTRPTVGIGGGQRRDPPCPARTPRP